VGDELLATGAVKSANAPNMGRAGTPISCHPLPPVQSRSEVTLDHRP
jgi:hypothetical protein